MPLPAGAALGASSVVPPGACCASVCFGGILAGWELVAQPTSALNTNANVLARGGIGWLMISSAGYGGSRKSLNYNSAPYSGLLYCGVNRQACLVDFAKFLAHFGRNLRQARWLTGQTQQEVAAQGLSLRWYAELERGQRNPTLRTVFDLAQILKVAPSELLEVPGARPGGVRLLDRKAAPPKKGRKPRKKATRKRG